VVRDLRSKGVRLPRPWAVGAIVGFDVAMPGLTVPRGTTAGDALVRTRIAWHVGRRATRSPPAPAGGFLWEGHAQEAPGGNPGTPVMKTIPPSMPHDGTQFPGSNPDRMACGKACDPESPGSRRGLFVGGSRPRSPGWKPGDTGHENHPAIHAARRHAISRFGPGSHGMWEGV